MTKRVQMELSDEERKIVEFYRTEQNKKNNEEAMQEIIKDNKPLSEHEGENKQITMDNNKEKKMGNKGGAIFITFAIGAVIGLAVGLLYAPKAGKETKALIKDKVQITKAKADEIVRQFKKNSSN